MSNVKKAWVAPFATSNELFVLGIESERTDEVHRLHVRENLFPRIPTPEHPLRHTVSLSLLDIDDLKLIQLAISEKLWELANDQARAD